MNPQELKHTLSSDLLQMVHPSRGEHVIPYMEWVSAEALGQTKLAFDDFMNQLHASQDRRGVEETLESEHRVHAAFYPSVILFDNVVQVGTVSNLDGRRPNDN